MRSSLTYAISGAFIGLAIFFFLTAVAIPNYDEYLIHIDQYNELKKIEEVVSIVSSENNIIPLILMVIPFSLIWFRFAGTINPQFRNIPFSKPEQPVKGWGLILLSGALFWYSLFVFSGLLESIGSTTSYSKIILSVIGCSFSWLFVSSKGIGEIASGPLTLNWKQYGHTFLRGLIFSIFVIAVFFTFIEKIFTILMTIIVEVFEPSMENSVFGYTGLLITLTLLTSLSFYITFELTPLFNSKKDKLKIIISKNKPVLLNAGIVSLLIASLSPLILNINHYKFNSLTDAAKLNAITPYKLKLVQFCNSSQCIKNDDKTKGYTGYEVSDWKTTVSTYGLLADSSDVPLHLDSISMLKNYILTDGKYSIYRKSAINALPQIKQGLWKPYDAAHANDFLINKGQLPLGSGILWPMTQLHWLALSAPITDNNKHDLERLSDPEHFYFGSARQLRALGNAWMRFGDAKKAEYFYSLENKSKQSNYLADKRMLSTIRDGIIKGHITVKDKFPIGIRVGLFKFSDNDEKNKNTSPYPHSIINISASQALDNSGKFSFQNLDNDDYYLALLVPEKLLNEKYQIITHMPVVININNTANKVNVGEIRIQ